MSPALHLFRFAYAPFGTYGILYAGASKLYTVEQPWRLNQKMRSCIPEGEYEIKPHHSKKYPNSFALVNHEIGVWHQPDPKAQPDARIAILIHPGNTPADISGCIAPGMSLGMLNNMWAVTNSKPAMDRVREYIQATGANRIIISGVDITRSVDEIPYGAAP